MTSTWDLLLTQALKTAHKMGSDPEHESIAGEATVHAVRSYDDSKGVTIEQWVSLVTRTHILTYWRSQKSRPMVYGNEEEPLDYDDEYSDTSPDWKLLVERFIDHVAEWSLARQYGVSVYVIRLRINAAIARFMETV